MTDAPEIEVTQEMVMVALKEGDKPVFQGVIPTVERMLSAALAVSPLHKRAKELEAEIADLKLSVVAFAGIRAVEYAKLHGLPKDTLHPTHYDLLEKCGARLDDFARADSPPTQSVL